MKDRRGLKESSSKVQEYILLPGHLIYPRVAKVICAVVTNGIVFTLFDTKKRQGGMGYFKFPKKSNEVRSSTMIAYPCIANLVSVFIKAGSKRENIVVNFYGGATRSGATFEEKSDSRDNVKVAHEIFNYFGLKVASYEVGGNLGRKIAFDSKAGNHVVALVENLRRTDW